MSTARDRLRAGVLVMLVVTAAWVLLPAQWRAGASEVVVGAAGAVGRGPTTSAPASPAPAPSLVGTVRWDGPELAPPEAYLDDPALYDPLTPQEREAHLRDWGLFLAERQARGLETGTDVGTWCTLLGPSTTTADLQACVQAWTEATATG